MIVAWLSLLLTTFWTLSYPTYLTVAQDGTGDYTTIQAAIDATKAFPDEPITIFIRKGLYQEKVEVFAWNTHLTILGEHRDSVVISWADHFKQIDRGRNSTFHTFTMKISANDVSLKNLTIRNASGPVGQAIALHVDADRVSIENCSLEGHQDTLYCAGEGQRQYFNRCKIEGTTDFIFGAATALFETCEIRSLANSYVTAASTPEEVDYGLVFKNCNLTAAEGVTEVYLGRPWRSYAQTVFVDCYLGAHIVPEGWHNWNDEEKNRTAFYAEYNSSGPGKNDARRVKWSHQFSEKEASGYLLDNIFGNWRPD